MIRRYTLAEMGAIWTEEARFEAMLRVELAVAAPRPRRGLIPAEALAALETRARIDVERIAEIERTTDHDVIAFVSQVAETVGPEGRYLHFGLTSSDVVDTGLALQLRAAGRAAARRRRPPDRGARRPGPGRGRDADDGPHPLGPRRADHARAQARRLGVRGRPRPDAAGGRRRRDRHRQDLRPGRDVQPPRPGDRGARSSPTLGLHADPVSTQIVQRDRHAALLTAIAILGGSLERFATEIRNLQHTEIGELQEPFKTGQKGSQRDAPQAQPDPVRADRRAWPGCCAATPTRRSRTSRSGTSATSATRSAERVILPDATIVLDYMLVRMTGLDRGARRPLRADAREHRPRPRPACEQPRARRARRGGRHVARGGLRDRPARRAAGGRRARAAARPAGRRPGRRPAAVARPSSTPASTTRRSCATSPRSSPGSTASSRRRRRREAAPDRRSPDAALTRSSAPARSATCTRCRTGGCCSSRATG